MRARSLLGFLVLLALLALAIPEVGWTQTPIQGLDRLSPEERAVAEKNLERWRSLPPEERQRILNNYQQWNQLSPEERKAARQNFQRFQRLKPEERQRILQDFKRWNELPEARRQELQKAHERFQSLPPERAVRMALEMRARVGALGEGWRKREYDLAFGIGIAHGYATIGAIGFEGRLDYGAIGTVTNLAARLCGEAGPDQILITRRLFVTIEEVVVAEPVGELTLKGITRPVPAFNVLGLKGA